MSAERKTQRPPSFTAYQEVEVDIDPDDLEREGWVYVGTGKAGGPAPMAEGRFERLVREFHEDEHEGPMVWCQHDLCMAVTR